MRQAFASPLDVPQSRFFEEMRLSMCSGKHLLDNGYDTQDRLKKRRRPEMDEGTVVRQACFEKMDAKTEEEDASANVGAQQT